MKEAYMAIAVGFGLLLMVSPVAFIMVKERLWKGRYTGTVLEYKTSKTKDGPMHKLRVRYVDINGVEQIYSPRGRSNYKPYPVGSEIVLRYNESNPEEVSMIHHPARRAVVFSFGGFGLFSIVCGLKDLLM